MTPAEEARQLQGVSLDPRRQKFKARIHYKGKERYICRCSNARSAGLAYDQVARVINASSTSLRRRPLNFPDALPNDPAIQALAARILMAADASDSGGSEGSASFEEEEEEELPQQLSAAAAGARHGGSSPQQPGMAQAAWPQQAGGAASSAQPPSLSPPQPSAQPGGSAPDLDPDMDSDEFECLMDYFLGAASHAAAAGAATPAAPAVAPAAVQQLRHAGGAQLLMPAAAGSPAHGDSPAASSSSQPAASGAASHRAFDGNISHAIALRAVSGAQHCIVDLRAAVLMRPDPLGCVAAFAASAAQRAHYEPAHLVAARLLQLLALALQVFRPSSALDGGSFVLTLLGQLQQALSGLQVMVAVRGREPAFDMRAVLLCWAAAVPLSCSGADAGVNAALAHLVQQL